MRIFGGLVLVTINCREIKFSNIEAIIFDKDGTLQNSQKFLQDLARSRAKAIDAKISGIGNRLLIAFGVSNKKIDPTGLMAVGSYQENAIAAAAYIASEGYSWFEAKSIALSAFKRAEKYLQNRTETAPIFNGSEETLKYLSRSGLKLGILSADSTAGVKSFVEHNQLSQYIQLTMGVDGEISKPNPALFLQACQSLQVEPKSTIMVGDSQGDIEMAKKAGAGGAIGICWGNSFAPHLAAADITISQLDEIKIIAKAI